MQIPLELDIWLQKQYETKEFEHCFCKYLKYNISDIFVILILNRCKQCKISCNRDQQRHLLTKHRCDRCLTIGGVIYFGFSKHHFRYCIISGTSRKNTSCDFLREIMTGLPGNFDFFPALVVVFIVKTQSMRFVSDDVEFYQSNHNFDYKILHRAVI